MFLVAILTIMLSFVVGIEQSHTVYAAGVQKGIASKATTSVYASTSTGSKVLKTYAKGSILQYSSQSGDWNSATVYLNGVKTKGYIRKIDVEDAVSNPVSLSGIGVENPTPVYAQASLASKKLKTYAGGTVLKYKTFTGDWYEATVYVNGKATSGYIHKTHVENKLNTTETIKGVGTANPTAVYSKAYTGSSKLKTYVSGTILTYRTFSENWYEATVYVSGKARTGYISKSAVESVVENQENLKGIGLQSSTAIYSKASLNSKKLKTYPQGTILSYKTFSSNWYEAVVYVNGKKTIGYIHVKHTEGLLGTSQSLEGISLASPTRVYSKASRNASVLKSYPSKRYLVFKTLSPNWYEAKVMINGKTTTGYIHRSDVSTDKVSIKTTSYSADFNKVVDIQMTKSPKADGAGLVPASRAQVEYYVNSSNFNKNSTDFYQFLVLSQPADLNANEVNQKILNNHGTLTGRAADFIAAGKKFNINEAYLISHALLETGNGMSTLAQGVPVDREGNVVSESQKVYTVYNMYGIGAVDSNVIKGGAKRAFNEGWFTPQAAIIGGAQFINTYIARGQDTLYKMRWNPISPGYPQYATDVGWATKQTVNISRIYSLLNRYILVYDVPRYANQPSSSGNPKMMQTDLFTRGQSLLVPDKVEDPIESDQEHDSQIFEVYEVDKGNKEEGTPESNVQTQVTPEVDRQEKVDLPVTEEETEAPSDSESVADPGDVNQESAVEEVQDDGLFFGVAKEDLTARENLNDLSSEGYLTIPQDTMLEIKTINGSWFEVEYEGQTGWVESAKLEVLNLLKVNAENVELLETPDVAVDSPVNATAGDMLAAVLDEHDQVIQKDGWYQVYSHEKRLWIYVEHSNVEFVGNE